MSFAENNRLATFRLQRVLSISLVLFAVILVLMSFDYLRAEVRDQKRKADIRQIVAALDLYYDEYEHFPEVVDNDWGDWDTSFKSQKQGKYFLDVLVSEGLIDRVPKDPINNEFFHYRYLKFPAGQYGCKKSFYVLQLSNFENSGKDKGVGECPEMNFVDNCNSINIKRASV